MTHQQMYTNLMKKLKAYHPADDFSMVDKAYHLALEAHGDQLRKSGEPYIIHPMSVALILADLKSDLETICAGILHDVIEDTKYSYEDIAREFGEEVAELVSGVTKLENLKYHSKEEEQAENYRKMFFSMAKDIRVLLIKMADRLHNLRTLQYMSPEKQKAKAQETLDIYAPLAHKLGISKIRYGLEDLSFKYLEPEAFKDLVEKMRHKMAERQTFVTGIVEDIRKRLETDDMKAHVVGRTKHLFSIYKKMVSQNKTLDQIYDLFAVRVIVETVRECYEVLGIVHDMYKPIPGRLKDYIALAKPNMYQSIHTTLIGTNGEPFEVQIRTWDMNYVAEYGIAAHWKYKERKGGIVDAQSEEAKFAWLRKILEWQMELSDNTEYLDAIKTDLDVYTDHVYCFSPKGDVISLLTGSTPIDFAYSIHSAVGNKMIGARVNDKIVTFDYQLKNGDRVDIITSQNSRGPSRDWLKIIKTSQARNKITQWFKKQNKDDNIIRGRELLEQDCARKKLVLRELLAEGRQDIALRRFGFKDWDSLCAAIGHGGIKEGQVVNRLVDEMQTQKVDEKTLEMLNHLPEEIPEPKKKKGNNSGILVRGVGDIAVRFSKCCRPVPGDEIVAFVTRGRGVSVHRTDCVNIMHLDEADRHRLIEAEWDLPDKSADNNTYITEIRIICEDRLNMLVDISRTFSDEHLKVQSLSARTVKDGSVVDVGLEVSSKEQLEKICQKILNIQGVFDINRITT